VEVLAVKIWTLVELSKFIERQTIWNDAVVVVVLVSLERRDPSSPQGRGASNKLMPAIRPNTSSQQAHSNDLALYFSIVYDDCKPL
jgi:hypothetical protein